MTMNRLIHHRVKKVRPARALHHKDDVDEPLVVMKTRADQEIKLANLATAQSIERTIEESVDGIAENRPEEGERSIFGLLVLRNFM
ncbi:unnamed protein product [Heligmosomoides polygyrus]|uniref:Uncharacterized protein n=1 Tax=Heligmosomoides polygyrus TaxID=6339 RepID=A0A183GP58_HELPZ|nr:unnamed protein product [Heligmosomoides polygyrus]